MNTLGKFSETILGILFSVNPALIEHLPYAWDHLEIVDWEEVNKTQAHPGAGHKGNRKSKITKGRMKKKHQKWWSQMITILYLDKEEILEILCSRLSLFLQKPKGGKQLSWIFKAVDYLESGLLSLSSRSDVHYCYISKGKTRILASLNSPELWL